MAMFLLKGNTNNVVIKGYYHIWNFFLKGITKNGNIVIKGRVPASLQIIKKAVIYSRKSAVQNVGKLKVKWYCTQVYSPQHYCQ